MARLGLEWGAIIISILISSGKHDISMGSSSNYLTRVI